MPVTSQRHPRRPTASQLAHLILLLTPTSCSVYDAALLANADGNGANASGGRTNSGGNDSGGAASDGSGGDDSSGGDTGSGAADSGGTPSTGGMGGILNPDPIYELIDDMEDNNPNIIMANQRNGRWNTYNDGTGIQSPTADFLTMFDVSADAPHASSHFAAHTSGSGFTGYGAVLNVTMKSWPIYEETPPYDASAYSGLSFFAKTYGAASNTVTLRLVSTDTDPRGGICKETGTVAERCFDHFTVQLTLSEEWERYEVSFDDFGQTGAGMQFPSPNLKSLYAIEFVAPGGSPFDVSIDDLSFVVAP